MKKASILLFLLLALCLMPTFVLADGVTEVATEEALADALSAGGEIRLTADITLTEVLNIPADKTVVLDLNGNDIIWDGGLTANVTAKTEIALLINNGFLTIQDHSNGESGSIVLSTTYSGASSSKQIELRAIQNVDTGTLVLNGGNIIAKNTATGAKYCDLCGVYGDTGNITVSDGNIQISHAGTGTTPGKAFGIRSGGGSVTVSGGAVSIDYAGGNASLGLSPIYGIYNQLGNITLSNGRVEVTAEACNSAIYGMNAGKAGIETSITINGGTVSVTGKTGGTNMTYAAYSQSGSITMNNGAVQTMGGKEALGLYCQPGPITVTNGTVNVKSSGNATAVYSTGSEAPVSISGGSFSAESANSTNQPLRGMLTVTGGEFNFNPIEYLQQGIYMVTATGTNPFTYGGTEGTYTYIVSPDDDQLKYAKVNGTEYARVQTAVDAAAAGDTVQLLRDVNMGANSLSITKGVTLDLNGYTLHGGKDNIPLTVSGGTAAQPAIITDNAASGFDDAGTISGSICVEVGGGYTQINKVNLSSNSADKAYALRHIGTADSTAHLTIDGVCAEVNGTGASLGYVSGLYLGAYSDTTINDTLTDFPTDISVSSGTITHLTLFYIVNNATTRLTVNDGKYAVSNSKVSTSASASLFGAVGSSATALINGGKYTLAASKTAISYYKPTPNALLYGGYYNFAPASNIPDDYVLKSDTSQSGYTHTVERTSAAKIGDVEYFTLQSAADAAAEGAVIVLMRDVVSTSTLRLNKTVTIDVTDENYTISLNAAIPISLGSGTTLPATFNGLYEAYVTNTDNSTDYYAKLSSAFSAADANEKVTLLKDCSSNTLYYTAGSWRSLTLDLNGNDLTCTAAGNAFRIAGPLSASDGDTYTFKLINSNPDLNGNTVTGGINIDYKGDCVTVIVGEGVNITAREPVKIIGPTLPASEGGSFTLNLYGKLTGTTATVPPNYAVLAGNGSSQYSNTTINIYDDALVSGGKIGIYHPQKGTLNIYGGTIIGETGVYIKSGTLNMMGGDIAGTGAFVETIAYNASGANSSGDALIVDSCGYPGGAPSVRISGGTLNGINAYALRECMTQGTEPAKQLLISGGSYKGAVGKMLSATLSGFMTGGKYSEAPADIYLADGYSIVENTGSDSANYPKLVAKINTAARIGSTYYSTLAAAVSAASTGETVELLANNTETIVINKTLTINKNSYTASGLSAGTGFVLNANAGNYTCAVATTAEIVVTDIVTAEIGDTIPQEDAVKIAAIINETQVIGVADAMKESSTNTIVNSAGVDASTLSSTDVVTVEVKVAVTATDAHLPHDLTFAVTPTATVLVNNIPQGDPAPVSNSALDGSPIAMQLPLPTGFTPEEIIHVRDNGSRERLLNAANATTARRTFEIVTENGQSFAHFTVTGFSEFIANGTPTIAAEIGSTKYGTLQEAIDAARSGDTIVLAKDSDETITVSGKSITIECGTYSYDDTRIGLGSNCTKTMDGTKISIAYTAPGGGGKNISHKINVNSSTDGAVTADRSNAAFGTTVKLTVTPDENYELYTLTIKDENGNSIAVSDNTFKMPASAVTITATFNLKGTTKFKFTDVAANSYYYDAVTWAVANGITQGTDATTFSPDATCTRAQMVTFLWRAVGSPEPTTTVNPFTDVTADAYYYKAVMWAAETGVTKGTSINTFTPDATVTREQMVTNLYRYAQSKGLGFTGNWMFLLDYNDRDSISDWAYEPFCWMTKNSIVEGSNGNLMPKANATRAQVTTILYRFFDEIK